ncbi:MAG: helix-turn-helix domain-containing protein [Undibacterium sp.]|nr:helix-turn-helix domain-containing protein [Opitutaceae bacterium]
MITDKIKELEATKAKIASLEKSIATQLQDELSQLPAQYGFATVQAFIKAVKAAAGGRRKKGKGKGKAAAKAGGAQKRTRATITDETRAELKKLAEAGKSGPEIAEALGISLPSVQNIKKALGLVKARK